MASLESLTQLHRTALAEATDPIARITVADLANDTPCAGWMLADLLAHMIGQNYGFAAAVRDGTAPREAYTPIPFSYDTWTDSAARLTEAFAATTDEERVVEIEFSERPVPVAFLVQAQLVDTVVHAWDVARSIGEEYVPSPELVEPVLAGLRLVPDSSRSETAGAAAFAPIRPSDGTDWDLALALAGRG